jgi:hypothetical protein
MKTEIGPLSPSTHPLTPEADSANRNPMSLVPNIGSKYKTDRQD